MFRLAFLILLMAAVPACADEIQSVEVGKSVAVPNNNGDTWAPAWAPDGTLYSPSDDSSGFKSDKGTNIHFNKITGNTVATLDGETVNPMVEYGKGSELGPDGFCWKSSGCISVDGVLYWVVARHKYDKLQTAQNASIIKSADGGKTWTRSEKENYDHPMFPGRRFATPYFIDYGQDGKAAVADGSDKYVYAMSNNGFWDNGDNMILGRVLKSKIGDLNAADWQFLKGKDGASDDAWTSDSNAARLVIDNHNHLGMGGPCYLAAKKCYFMIGWYYPAGGGRVSEHASEATRWDFYTAPHPWGPWKIVGSHDFKPEAFYGTQVALKLCSPDDSQLQVFTCGNFNAPYGALYYKLTVVPLTLR